MLLARTMIFINSFILVNLWIILIWPEIIDCIVTHWLLLLISNYRPKTKNLFLMAPVTVLWLRLACGQQDLILTENPSRVFPKIKVCRYWASLPSSVCFFTYFLTWAMWEVFGIRLACMWICVSIQDVRVPFLLHYISVYACNN